MIALIEVLVAGGHAYTAEGTTWFDVSTWPAYGRLGGYDNAAMRNPGRRAGRNPRRSPPAQSAGLRAVAAVGARRAVLGLTVRTGPSRLACRVQRHVDEPARGRDRSSRRWQRSDLPAPRVRDGSERGRRQPPIREALDALRDGRLRRHQDVEVAGQSRVRQRPLQGQRPGCGPPRPDGAPLSRRLGMARRRCRRERGPARGSQRVGAAARHIRRVRPCPLCAVGCATRSTTTSTHPGPGPCWPRWPTPCSRAASTTPHRAVLAELCALCGIALEPRSAVARPAVISLYDTLTGEVRPLTLREEGQGGAVRLRPDRLRPSPPGPRPLGPHLRRAAPLPGVAGPRRAPRGQHHRHRRQHHQPGPRRGQHRARGGRRVGGRSTSTPWPGSECSTPTSGPEPPNGSPRWSTS